MKTCYYELLEVSSDANDTELKKAYRKKALQLHPDKNPENVEEANHKFSLVRAAYEVLSDPQERAWYDSHKASILNDDDQEIVEGESYLPSLSTEEIYRFFNPGMYTTMDDSISGFYAVVARIFDRLAHEEVLHGKYNKVPGMEKFKDDDPNSNAMDESYLKYPRFGNSKSSYVDNVRNFYNVWGSFLTAKNFNWKDEYRYLHASDRRTRRMMERENKKIREDARKEYNEAIKKYVNFIKKRDPRVKAGQEELQRMNKRKQLEEYQNQIRQLNLNKLKEMNEFAEQDWQKMDPEELKELEEMLEDEYQESTDSEFDEFEEGEELEVHEFECVVCDKVFKNEQQFKIHEESKKHKKSVRQLQWEMKQEGIDLGIDKHDEDDLSEFETASSHFLEGEEEDELTEEEKDDPKEEETKEVSIDIENLEVDDDIEEEDLVISSPKEEINPLEADLAKLMGKTKLASDDEDDDYDWLMDTKKKSKKGKKAKKKGKKGSTESTPAPESEPTPKSKAIEKCTICGQTFDSRNQLFAHLKSSPPLHQLKTTKKKSKRK
ncbi:J protein JJJ1 [Candida viswanathii]|uniref:J protein JJJ1 n=1 Tax=Candida viswanathii TaxID=5486 RepID=A0A367YD00_9ASCO|nr:J protein JJJ1 [Candida viswanathii]